MLKRGGKIKWVSIGPRLFRHGNYEPKVLTEVTKLRAFQLGHVFSDMEIGFHFGPALALDFSSICEHLPFLPQNTSLISVFQGHYQYALALRAPPGVWGINELLAKDLI